MSDERRLPDGEGVWWNEEGQWVASGRYKEGEWWIISSHCERLVAANRDLNKVLELLSVSPGRWRRAEPPEFEPQEPRPPMVWAKPSTGHPPSWWAWCSKTGFFVSCLTCHGKRGRGALTVIPHPQNDPEAVQIIEEAQRHEP